MLRWSNWDREKSILGDLRLFKYNCTQGDRGIFHLSQHSVLVKYRFHRFYSIMFIIYYKTSTFPNLKKILLETISLYHFHPVHGAYGNVSCCCSWSSSYLKGIMLPCCFLCNPLNFSLDWLFSSESKVILCHSVINILIITYIKSLHIWIQKWNN